MDFNPGRLICIFDYYLDEVKFWLVVFLLLIWRVPQIMAQQPQGNRIELIRFDMDTIHFLQDTVNFYPDSTSNYFTSTIYLNLDTFSATINTFYSWRIRVKNISEQTLEYKSVSNSGGPIIGEIVQPRIIYPYKEMDLTGLIDNNKFSEGHFYKTISYYFDAGNRQYAIHIKMRGYKKILYR